MESAPTCASQGVLSSWMRQCPTGQVTGEGIGFRV